MNNTYITKFKILHNVFKVNWLTIKSLYNLTYINIIFSIYTLYNKLQKKNISDSEKEIIVYKKYLEKFKIGTKWNSNPDLTYSNIYRQPDLDSDDSDSDSDSDDISTLIRSHSCSISSSVLGWSDFETNLTNKKKFINNIIESNNKLNISYYQKFGSTKQSFEYTQDDYIVNYSEDYTRSCGSEYRSDTGSTSTLKDFKNETSLLSKPFLEPDEKNDLDDLILELDNLVDSNYEFANLKKIELANDIDDNLVEIKDFIYRIIAKYNLVQKSNCIKKSTEIIQRIPPPAPPLPLMFGMPKSEPKFNPNLINTSFAESIKKRSTLLKITENIPEKESSIKMAITDELKQLFKKRNSIKKISTDISIGPIFEILDKTKSRNYSINKIN